MHVTGRRMRFKFPAVFHSARSCVHLKAPDDRWIWTTIPADRVIRLQMYFPSSTRPQKMNGLFHGRYGTRPLNVEYEEPGGTRVVRMVPIPGSRYFDKFWVHMNDFNPSAVARGIRKVVREPTVSAGFTQYVVTYFPYAEVVNPPHLSLI
ncbi:hypothetical protein EDB19DRAFT_1829429 [Suillus lakei]|nr:hypothetical protein EDB19DRAFT_1829429 [Suillus lakei]